MVTNGAAKPNGQFVLLSVKLFDTVNYSFLINIFFILGFPNIAHFWSLLPY